MKQQLSALIDGEADIERCEHVFLAAKSTGEVAEAWRHYHVIRDVMRDELFVQSSDMSRRIMAAIDDEPTVLAPAATMVASKVTHIRPQFGKYTWSIAASVAAAFFVGLFVVSQSGVSEPVQIADNDADQYVMAHHNYAPNSATYYIHNVAYSAGE
ncbi:sigma-E factor negative regulatory protein [Methylophilus aquaticus]|uniref:Sigma-E factor negative regulatory protein n=1 Tax=Methylophilus aquaticus TaxID=1971610 RepID=A0ABT9JTU6_9PROT|nr:sigma-E factor negative regulatory protein [Methylophilus aquaticus]MDP8568017.1 sigma-E factor negative regulatory protein [Methylophilus aquaticus]